MPTLTAALTAIVRADDGAILLIATCGRCRRTVTHGAGRHARDVAAYLGDRVAHCSPSCRAYDLTDPRGLLADVAVTGIPPLTSGYQSREERTRAALIQRIADHPGITQLALLSSTTPSTAHDILVGLVADGTVTAGRSLLGRTSYRLAPKD